MDNEKSLAVAEDTAALSPTATVEEAFERFLRLSVADGAASHRTIRAYREGIGVFLSWCAAAKIDPKQATFDQLQVYRKHLNDRFAKSTVRARLTAVRVLYQALQRWGMRADNPCAGIKAPSDKTVAIDRLLRKALTPLEAGTLLRGMSTSPEIPAARDRAIIYLMVLQGLREEEICTLQLADLDTFAYNSLQVHGKGGKMRTVILCEPVKEALTAWITRRGAPEGTASYLFERVDGSTGKPLSVRTIERIADRYLMLYELKKPGRSAHALRHTYALLAVLGGAERERLGDSMGHASLATTDIYIRAAARYQANPADAAASMLSQKKEENPA